VSVFEDMKRKLPQGTPAVSDAAIVTVRREWNDWRKASYRLADLEGVHWSQITGGVGVPVPQPFIHGYVSCDQMLEGELAHSGSHGPCPHRIKVCIVKADNEPAVFRRLVQQAGPKPPVSVFRVEAHAREIAGALLQGSVHPCISRKGDLLVVNPRKLPGLSDAGVQTVTGRSKRLKAQVVKLVEGSRDFEQVRYGQMLAYRRRDT
jgi:hypothetical protein